MREPASVVARSPPLLARVAPLRRSTGVDPAYGSRRLAQGLGNKRWPLARITSHFGYPKVEASLLSLRPSSRGPEPRFAGALVQHPGPDRKIQESTSELHPFPHRRSRCEALDRSNQVWWIAPGRSYRATADHKVVTRR